MSFERPTLSEIIARVQSDAESRLGKKPFRWSLVSVMSRVVAGVAHALYGYVQFALRQIFSSTAEGRYLERRASEFSIYRKPAVVASGSVVFDGDGVVPEGTQLQSEDGRLYVTAEESSDGSVMITAVVAGSEGNSAAGLELTLVSPVAGVQSTCVAGELTGGVDAEDDESLRERLLFRQKNPPRAGVAGDYVAWALEVPGVTRAWCFPKELGPGRVTVRFMTDGMTDNGIPNNQMIETVEEYVKELMPVTAILVVVAPVPKSLDMTLDILPDTAAARAKITSAVERVVIDEASPGGAVMLTSLTRAVASVNEVKSFRIVAPTDDVTCSTGELLVPGEITYQ